MYTSAEVKEKFSGDASVFPNTTGEIVIVVGADVFTYAVAKKMVEEDKLYMVIDSPILLRGAGLQMNGVLSLPYGRHFKAPLSKKPPRRRWAFPNGMNAGQVLKRNAKRIDKLVKDSKGKALKSGAMPFHDALIAVKKTNADAMTAKKEAKKEKTA
jgi:hypothetical protein